MQCTLCKRQAKKGEGLCRYHSEAKVALRKSYDVWNEAYQGISWKEYLNRVKTAEGTGEWVKEVIMSEERDNLS
jgi:hypothetical protein